MTRSDDDVTRPKQLAPLPPPPQAPPIRSAQQTLVMGGNVNAKVGALPPPPVLPEELVERASATPSAPLPPPALPPETKHAASDPANPASGSLPPPPVLPPHLAGQSPLEPSAPARVVPLASAPPPSLSDTLPPGQLFRLPGSNFAAIATAVRARTTARTTQWGTKARMWLEQDRRRWSVPAGALVLLIVVVVIVVTGSDEDAARPRAAARVGASSPELSESDEALSAKDPEAEQKPPARRLAPEVDSLPVVGKLPKQNANADHRFAVRERRSLESCDEALGKRFVAEAEPNRGQAGLLWTKSRKSLMLGRSDRALKEMCESASWDIEGRATYGLSEYYFREGDFEQALIWAERVSEGSRREVDARAMIGDIYSQVGNVQAAREAFIRGWNMDAEDAQAHERVAVEFAQSASSAVAKKDWWTAERFYRRALTLSPKNAAAATGLSRVFLYFDLPAAAVVWAEHALEQDRDSTLALLALCEAHLLKKDASGARAALGRLRELTPDDPKVRSLANRVDAL